jgi:uncharacterized protein YdcH (DUF465 family)
MLTQIHISVHFQSLKESNMNIQEPAPLSKPWNHKELYDNFNFIATEVENARGGFSSLLEKEDDQDSRLANLEAAKGEFETLLERENTQENRLADLENAKGEFNSLLERENTQGGRITELEQEILAARQNENNLLNTLQLYLKTGEGFSDNLKANNYKLTDLGLASEPNDAVTLSQVSSMLTLGGQPSNVALLDLSTQGLMPGQNIEISADGQNITGSQIIVIETDNYQTLAGQNIIINAHNSLSIQLPQNPISGITEVNFLAFIGKIGQNNTTIFASDFLIGGKNQIVIRKNQALKFVFMGGDSGGWLMIEQSTAGSSVDTPSGFSTWYKAIAQPSVHNILRIV